MTDGSVISPVTIAMIGGARPQSTPKSKGETSGEGDKIQLPYYEDLKKGE